MAKIYTKDQIHQLKDMVIFFDANILIYLFMPTGNLFFETAYSSIFALLLKEKNTLIIDFLVLSEFINRASRIDHEKYLSLNKIDKNKLPYKKYRDSADGQEKLQGIYDLVSNKFLKFFQIIEHGFNHDDITKMLNVDSLDFNDKGIEQICINNNFVLLTNDADYKETSLDILTSNKRLMRDIYE